MTVTPRSRVRVKSDGPNVLDGTAVGSDDKIRILGDDGKIYAGALSAPLRFVDTTIPEGLVEKVEELVAAMARKWKKGDRASIADKDKMLHGTIAKGGAKPVMVIDGGEYQIAAPARDFRPGPDRQPEPPSIMDRWAVRNYREIKAMSEETVAYTAKIYRDGQLVIHASNDGHGGSDRMMPAQGHNWKVIEELEADAKRWFADHGRDEAIEPESSWIMFAGLLRPQGMTAEDYMAQQRRLDEETAQIRIPSAPGM